MACVRKRRGRYVLDFYDHTGKRNWETMPEGTTKKRADDELRKHLNDIAKGIYRPEKLTPLFSSVAKDWLEHKKPNLRESTFSVYEGHVKNHFHDLDNIPINRINVARVEKWISARQKDNMHILTLRKTLVTFNQIMAYSVRHRYLDSNPVRDAEKPRTDGRHGNKREMVILTPEQIGTLINEIKHPKYRKIIFLAAMSGMREGELLGLKWSDFDWKEKQVHVQRTYNNHQWFEVKTKTSNRRVDLGPSTIAELKKWKLACNPNDLDLVFPNDAGQPIDRGNLINRYFNPALEKVKASGARFHDLRHFYASMLIAQGEPLPYIQKQLGHSSPNVTLNVYTHLIKQSNQGAVTRLENAVLKNDGSKMVAKAENRKLRNNGKSDKKE
jgi:integrase